MDFALNLTYNKMCNNPYHEAFLGLIRAKLSKKKKNWSKTGFWRHLLWHSQMTLKVCLRSLHTLAYLPKGTLWVRYGPDLAKGRDDMHRTINLGQTGRQTDGQADLFSSPANRDPNKLTLFFNVSLYCFLFS